MGRNKGASIARQIKRGKADPNGRPLQKRPFNNSKRTKGRKAQKVVQGHYEELMRRTRYIKKLIKAMQDNNERLEANTWINVVRKYDSHQLLFDEFEIEWMFKEVNNDDNRRNG